ncbi:MAG: hypothetical protein UW52_C0005G0003 [Candidatus Gottesmanbacteria bacterium GW2011_GWA1_44_24b]|nr:MAG: hypothetical protein UW52_C0005G0003 [Candidatus Gottesmanbacteria bacterium GW2011_GWA1_44_24b]
MPYGVPLLEQMTDEELESYLSGEVIKATMGLPGSGVVSIYPAIVENLKEIRERSRVTLAFDVAYAKQEGRPVPEEVLQFLSES